MNTRSLLITIAVAFVTMWATDFLIHAVWLGTTYKETASLWRPESDLMTYMPWMLFGQFLAAAAFTLIFAACVAEKRCPGCTMKYSACMGIFAGGGQIIMYAVQPLPGSLVTKWVLTGIVQAMVLGFIVHKLYKPLPAAAKPLPGASP